MTRLAGVLLLALLWGCGERAPDADGSNLSTSLSDLAPSASLTLWQSRCSACHGAAGEGNASLNAPALTQLSGWYLSRQLTHFASGVRGAHPDDLAGQQMAAGSQDLSAEQAAALADFISVQLPAYRPSSSMEGNLERGQDYYMNLCSACHGGDALGNEALGAPALAGQNDWYLARQYQGFLQGWRGVHPDDRYGAQMARLAPALTSSSQITDVIRYITSLPPRRT